MHDPELSIEPEWNDINEELIFLFSIDRHSPLGGVNEELLFLFSIDRPYLNYPI